MRGRVFGVGEVSVSISQRRKAWLLVQGNRIIYCDAYILLLERAHQRITMWAVDDELIIDVPPVPGFDWHKDSMLETGSEKASILVRIALAGRRPGIQILEFGSQDGCLKGI